jgi:hypothetical protein
VCPLDCRFGAARPAASPRRVASASSAACGACTARDTAAGAHGGPRSAAARGTAGQRQSGSILDQRGGATAARKTVSVVVADNMTAFIRSTSNYTIPGRFVDVPLNVDVEPQIIADNKLRVRLGLQYDLPNSLASAQTEKPGELFTTQLRENLSLILENGKSIVAAQSADPVGDRQVTIEVKATILR